MPTNKGRLLLLHGPNLHLLGSREPSIYGTATLADHVQRATATAQRLGYEVDSEQSDDLATLIGIVQTAGTKYAGIVLNAAAFTHFAWSLHDALKSVGLPVVEVHLSNPAAREPWRHESVIAPVAIGTIAGFGGESYVLGIEALTRHLEK
ncbi:MAG: 3-dehydroquinate dehydratase [Actinomycetota bacterium]|jgi:3-dehydroquinate dehydratase II|nr:3-dehydroquinate dehydratase [Actinomycetota bacterium]MDP4642205.1 3-dehydroquinate dehydratase [Ilumatobacteraceae bacterium]